MGHLPLLEKEKKKENSQCKVGFSRYRETATYQTVT